ncbi:MAG TPA: aldehyde dehydrogenase family protein, partial [Pseudonocardia sp.]|nr:aldehyde dehydrogenase family protein [Pseudonocardia sp.]
MTTSVDVAPAASFDSLDPRTGEVVASYPVHTEVDVRAAVDRATATAVWWDELGFAGRRERLLAWRKVLVGRLDELAGIVSTETGKPFDDARLEIVL